MANQRQNRRAGVRRSQERQKRNRRRDASATKEKQIPFRYEAPVCKGRASAERPYGAKADPSSTFALGYGVASPEGRKRNGRREGGFFVVSLLRMTTFRSGPLQAAPGLFRSGPLRSAPASAGLSGPPLWARTTVV